MSLLVAPAMAGTIVLEGNYQGKNIYVQNPFSGTGVGFCTYEVRVNGDVSTDEINSSAFEIDLANFQFKIGDKLTIQIKHKDDCKPKVLNPEVLKPKSTFVVDQKNIKVDPKTKVLTWTSTGETGKLAYVVEQFRWNKWIKVGEVEGNGTQEASTYSFQVTPHSGENKFRVKQVDYTGRARYSPSVRYREMEIGPVTFVPKEKVKDKIEFISNEQPIETMYEIYDSYGNIVKKGFGNVVDAKNLKDGVYYLNYDNMNAKFLKK